MEKEMETAADEEPAAALEVVEETVPSVVAVDKEAVEAQGFGAR